MKKNKFSIYKFGDVAVVAALATIIYLAFTPLFGQSESLITSETISAAASAILAAAFTWALLKRQSESARENTFLDKQLEIFSDELKSLASYLIDEHLNRGTVDRDDLQNIKLRIMQTQLTLEVVSTENVAKRLRRILYEVQGQINDDQTDYSIFVKEKLFNSLLILGEYCRQQLLLPGAHHEELLKADQQVIDDLPTSEEQHEAKNRNSRDTTKYIVNGQGPLSKRKAALEIVKLVVEDRKPRSHEELKELFPDSSYRLHTNNAGTAAKGEERVSVINSLAFAREIMNKTGIARHWLDQEDLLKLGSDQAAVSNQWGENFKPFVNQFISETYPEVRKKIQEVNK